MTAVAAYHRKPSHLVRFDHYEADLFSGELRKSGIRVPLREQSFQALAALLEHPGELVTRDELCHRLWHGDVFVDFENNLNAVVARLRQALCDSAEHPRFIETLPKRGYRFIGTVCDQPRTPNPGLLGAPADPAEDCVVDAGRNSSNGGALIAMPVSPLAPSFLRSKRALAAAIQLLYFLGWVYLYHTALELSARVSDPTLVRVLSHRESLFWSLLIGFGGCVAELLIAVLMARHSTPQKVLDYLFAIYLPLNLFGGALFLGWFLRFLPVIVEAILVPVVVLFFLCGPFLQRRLLTNRN